MNSLSKYIDPKAEELKNKYADGFEAEDKFVTELVAAMKKNWLSNLTLGEKCLTVQAKRTFVGNKLAIRTDLTDKQKADLKQAHQNLNQAYSECANSRQRWLMAGGVALAGVIGFGIWKAVKK